MTTALLASSASYAADAAFQNFLFAACTNATGQLAQRCAESANGDVSEDSESSLTPTQSLSYGANALQETVANLRAQREKKQQLDSRAKIASSDFDRFTATLYLDQSSLERSASSRERGYDIDMQSLRFNLDYRVDDRSFVGASLSAGGTDTDLDGYRPEGAFPDYNRGLSGNTESDTVSLSVYGSRFLTEKAYIDTVVVYTDADYRFRRLAVFQDNTRAIDSPVSTRASSAGSQFSLGIGLGYDYNWRAHQVNVYARMDYQESSIDGYRERGGNGLGMRMWDFNGDQLLTTAGVRLSRAMAAGNMVLIPQAFAELQQRSGAGEPGANASFLEDSAGTVYRMRGDAPDSQLQRIGVSLVAVMTHGISGFIDLGIDLGESDIDRHQLSAGLRQEF